MADEVLDGSCLCGAVRYRVRGPFMRFVHCHCSRCRKATGSRHATNLIAEPANLEWIAGRDQTQRFDLPLISDKAGNDFSVSRSRNHLDQFAQPQH